MRGDAEGPVLGHATAIASGRPQYAPGRAARLISLAGGRRLHLDEDADSDIDFCFGINDGESRAGGTWAGRAPHRDQLLDRTRQGGAGVRLV